jgi:hypothetical protein
MEMTTFTRESLIRRTALLAIFLISIAEFGWAES